MDEKVMRYDSQIKINPASLNKVNNQFALVDILLCYEGRNRNRTSISKKAIENNLYSLYGCPIIGEWITKDDGSKDFGTHGGRIIIDDNGIRYEETTHAYGFITRDAVENAKWVIITEKDGHTKHDYLELKDCFVWQKRFKEVSTLLDENRPQSMELTIEKAHEDSDGYLVIEDFTFTAACILGSDVSPCFESAAIGRHYELDGVKSDLDVMMKEYQKYKENYSDKEAKQMDLSKIKSKLSEFTYKNELGEDCGQYALVSVTDDAIGVFDRQDYNVYSFDYTIKEDDLVFDDTSKKLSACAVIPAAEGDEETFSIANEVNSIKSVCQAQCNKAKEESLAETCKTLSEEYSKKVDELTNSYDTLLAEFKAMEVDYNRLREADEDHKFSLHKAEIDGVIGEFKSQIGMYPKYLVYCSKVDYSKTAEEVRKELTLIAGEAAINKNGKRNFTYEPTEARCSLSKNGKRYAAENRYGNLFDKFKK